MTIAEHQKLQDALREWRNIQVDRKIRCGWSVLAALALIDSASARHWWLAAE